MPPGPNTGLAQVFPHRVLWFHDHLEWDAAFLRSWLGQPVDPDGPIGIETLVSAAQELHPEWMAVLGPYFAMEVMPAALPPPSSSAHARQGWLAAHATTRGESRRTGRAW